MISSAMQKLFKFHIVQWSILGILFKEYLYILMSKHLVPAFSSASLSLYEGLPSILSWCLHRVRDGDLALFFFMWIPSFFNSVCWRSLISPMLVFVISVKINWLQWDPIFHLIICLFWCQSTVLLVVWLHRITWNWVWW